MAKRRKKLKQRLLTYGEIDKRMTRKCKTHGLKDCMVTLYGSVGVRIGAINSNHFEIAWFGNLSRAGGPSVNRVIVLARVYALSDGDTGYVVAGAGKVRNNTEEDHAAIKVWRRYVGVFTPHNPKDRITEAQRKPYRLSKGEASSDARIAIPGTHPIMEGCWWTMPSGNRPNWKRWVYGWDDDLRGFPKFVSRSKRFVYDLKKRLADGPTCVVQLLHRNEGKRFIQKGLQFHICLPPSRTAQGKRLIVHAAMHDKESRHFHHVDGDYAPRHSQYLAWEQLSGKTMRWKCGKDAMEGIVEWVMSSIHIPGPE